VARLTKQAIAEKQDQLTEEVEMPEWGGSVLLRSMTMADRKELVAYMDKHGKVAAQLYLVSRCLVDPILAPEDLATKNVGAIDTLAKVAMRLSGVTEEEQRSIERTFR